MPDVSSGWGRLTWGQANWNEATTLTQGWGAEAWGSGGSWGDVGDEIVSITGLEISSTYNPSITITAPWLDAISIPVGSTVTETVAIAVP